jgi:hypothetical protein
MSEGWLPACLPSKEVSTPMPTAKHNHLLQSLTFTLHLIYTLLFRFQQTSMTASTCTPDKNGKNTTDPKNLSPNMDCCHAC